MISANELRIGNWIFIDNGEKPQYAHQVAGHDIEEIEGCGTDCFPIPLTPDILEKAGFLKYLVDESEPEAGYYYHKEITDDKYCDLSFITGDKNGITEVCLFPYETWFRVQYLHQLQNLTQALTSTELTVEL